MVEESAAGLYSKFSLTTLLYKLGINKYSIQKNVITKSGKTQMIVNIWWVGVVVAWRAHDPTDQVRFLDPPYSACSLCSKSGRLLIDRQRVQISSGQKWKKTRSGA